ncbi:hypothetical protein CQ011_17485 [Arthrobacter sp. MYb213]|nr:hypothetical protein CQ011_17485 [Arthrobacter sp. MYb213]
MGHVPDTPWAVYLADTDGLFHLLGIDLDAKNDEQAALAGAEALMISRHLDAVGIEHVVCQSGQSGGRHVWVAMAEPLPRDEVLLLRHALKLVATRLDHNSLTNPATGCLRPPGSLHRDGSYSEPLKGHLGTLLNPSTTAAQIQAVIERLETVAASAHQLKLSAAGVEASVAISSSPGQRSTRRPGSGTGKTVGTMQAHPDLPIDEHGMPYLPGIKRPKLPAASQAALNQDTRDLDASAVFWTVLLGMARACWRYSDLVKLVETAPGLEHVRTTRRKNALNPTGERVTRSVASQKYVLEWTWLKATTKVCSEGAITGHDPEFEQRKERIHHLASVVQQRADASVGRWDPTHHKGGPTDRRVLDALSLWTLQAIQPEIEADIRRLALTCGIGRETARQALHRLAADGWIIRTKESEGVHGATWTIDPQKVIHKLTVLPRSQGGEAAAYGFDPLDYSELCDQLSVRLALAAHDCFTPGALSHYEGNIYAQLSQLPGATIEELSLGTGTSQTYVEIALGRLHDYGLCASNGSDWVATPPPAREQVARSLGTLGILEDRETRYWLERELWDWWQQELAWMKKPRGIKQRRAVPGQLTLLSGLERVEKRSAYPRTGTGLGSHRMAKAHLAQTIHSLASA